MHAQEFSKRTWTLDEVAIHVCPYGQSGKMLSDVVQPLGQCVNDIAFIHNMVGKTGVHSQATYLQATGFELPGFPGMGCWVSYALGSLNDNLPTFVVLPDHRGYASNGPKNWDSAFLSASSQGTAVFPKKKIPLKTCTLVRISSPRPPTTMG